MSASRSAADLGAALLPRPLPWEDQQRSGRQMRRVNFARTGQAQGQRAEWAAPQGRALEEFYASMKT